MVETVTLDKQTITGILYKLNLSYFQEFKALNNPPQALVSTFAAVSILQGEKQNDWREIQKRMKNPHNFLQKMIAIDID